MIKQSLILVLCTPTQNLSVRKPTYSQRKDAVL